MEEPMENYYDGAAKVFGGSAGVSVGIGDLTAKTAWPGGEATESRGVSQVVSITTRSRCWDYRSGPLGPR